MTQPDKLIKVIGIEHKMSLILKRADAGIKLNRLELIHASVRTQNFAEPDAFYPNLPEERHGLNIFSKSSD